MEKPIKSQGYEKYIIQVGWWNPAPDILVAVLGQDVLAKSKADGNYLMKILYPEDIGEGLPYLCPIIEEVGGYIDDEGGNTIELIYPN